LTRTRSLLFDLVLVLWTALFALGIPVLWACGSPRRGIRWATRQWVRGMLLALRHIVGLTHVEIGRENVPLEPCLIVSNHQSAWETLAYLLLFPDVAIIAKQELLSIPVFGWYLRHSPMIIIDRETGTKALRSMVEESRTALSQGRSVLIFPEGTRKAPDEPVTFKRGVEMLYARLGVPVLPVAINAGRFWGSGSGYKQPGRITVSILAPIGTQLAGAEFTQTAEGLLEAGKAA
jgi:1-acyl-sn-glycerol-3-phosphate acyltransferase